MNAYDELKIIAKNIPRGVTENGILCPWCQGGRHEDKAFSVTIREDGVALFMCHRASCGRHGRLFGHGNISVSHSDTKESKLRPYQGESLLPSPLDLAYLEEQYGFTPADAKRGRLFVDKETGRLGIPVVGPQGQMRGVELRFFGHTQNKQVRKTLHFKELDEPWLGWFSSPNSREPIVLVEDVLSALKVSRMFISVSLMGSHISLDDMMEICRHSDQIILCLDRDATNSALELKKRFMYICPQLHVVPLPGRDLKSLPDRDIQALVQGTFYLERGI